MKSVVCVKPGLLEIQEREDPPLLGGEVKVRIRRVGVCGTDFHIYKGLHPFLNYPRTIGHELSGEVADSGTSTYLKTGDAVIINPYLPCGDCVACRKNKPNCCANIRVFGVHTEGGMSEFLNVPEKQLYVADGLSLDEAAMVEFLAIGAHGIRRSEVEEGDRLLVVGAGPIGLGAALFAKIAGANVTMLDLSAVRIERAQSMIDDLNGVVGGPTALETLEAYTNGDLFNVVVDATGNVNAMQGSLEYVAHGGSCVFISVVKDTISFSDPLFHSREMRIIGSRNATKTDFEHVIEVLKSGRIPTEKMLTHRAPLVSAPDKIPAWLNEQDTLVKAILEI